MISSIARSAGCLSTTLTASRFAMPKAPLHSFPVSGLFGVVKPPGRTSMSVINDIKLLVSSSRLFVEPSKLDMSPTGKKHGKSKRARGAVKIGQGGTLDPLADGVLVIGIGKATKQLGQFLDCTKEYRATCLLGCETDTYDSEGKRVRTAPWKHVTRDNVQSALGEFTGEIQQTPPIFSALKMDGRPLYEYARKGIPLPRPIEPRQVTVQSLELVDWKGDDHEFRWPEKSLSQEEKAAVETAIRGIDEAVSLKDDVDPAGAEETPSAFVLKMTVSGGTYVRSIVHDLAHSIGSAGHVVTLTRLRQGRFVLGSGDGDDETCVPWEVFERAISTDGGERDADGWTEWEREVMQKVVVV